MIDLDKNNLEMNNLEMEKMKQEIEMMRLQNESLRYENEQRSMEAEINAKIEEEKANSLALWCMLMSFAFIIPVINNFSVIVSIILGIVAIKKRATKTAYYTVGLIVDGLVILGALGVLAFCIGMGYI